MALKPVGIHDDGSFDGRAEAWLKNTFAAAPTDLVLYVRATGGSDTASGLVWGEALATLDEAFDRAAVAGGARIELSGGVHSAPESGCPDCIWVNGQGIGVTTVRLPDGAERPVIGNANTSGPDGQNYVSISNLTIDGNKGGQSWSAGTGDEARWEDGLRSAVYLFRVRQHFAVNVEIKNAKGHGYFYTGYQGEDTRYSGLVNIFSHHNELDGGRLGSASRACQVTNITAWQNGRVGWFCDASEAQYTNIFAYMNGTDGIWVRNIFVSNLTNLKAEQNGGHGIHVTAMTNSQGASWQSHNNGRNAPDDSGDYYDVYFDNIGAPTFGYGNTAFLRVNGIQAGHTKGTTNWKGDAGDGNLTKYAVYVESGNTGRDVVLSGVHATECASGDIFLAEDATGWLLDDGKPHQRVVKIDANAAVTNTTTETALVTLPIPARSPRPGDRYRLRVSGNLNLKATSGDIDLRVRIGGVGGHQIARVTFAEVGSDQNGNAFYAEFDVVVRTVNWVGNSANWIGSGRAQLAANPAQSVLGQTSSPVSRTWTGVQDLCVTVQFANAVSGHTLTLIQASIDKVGVGYERS